MSGLEFWVVGQRAATGRARCSPNAVRHGILIPAASKEILLSSMRFEWFSYGVNIFYSERRYQASSIMIHEEKAQGFTFIL